MQVTVVGRHHPIDTEIREYASKKLLHIERLSSNILKCEVIFEKERKQQIAEIVLSLRRGVTLVARAGSDDLRAAIDMAVEKLEHQLDKYKVRRVRKRHLLPRISKKEEKETVEGED